jgi:hypothetical protein
MGDDDFDPADSARYSFERLAKGRGVGKGCLVSGVRGRRRAKTLALIRELCEKGIASAEPAKDNKPRKLLWYTLRDFGPVLEQYAENAVLVIENADAFLSKDPERTVLELILEADKPIAIRPLKGGSYALRFGGVNIGLPAKLSFTEGAVPEALIKGMRFRPYLLLISEKDRSEINPRIASRCTGNIDAAELWG